MTTESNSNDTVIIAIVGAIVSTGVVLGSKVASWVKDNWAYDDQGFNKRGFDKQGKDRDGFDKQGYDEHGRDHEGFDRYGLDIEGFDREGFSRQGRNREGFDRRGFDLSGFDASGFDASGFDRMGYNVDGLDRSGKDVNYYNSRLEEVSHLTEKAHHQMAEKEYPYALHDIRQSIEICLKCILEHKGDGPEEYERVGHLLDRTSSHFEDDFTDKVRGALKHCNDTQHDSADGEMKNYNQVYFCYMTLQDLTEKTRSLLGLHVELKVINS